MRNLVPIGLLLVLLPGLALPRTAHAQAFTTREMDLGPSFFSIIALGDLDGDLDLDLFLQGGARAKGETFFLNAGPESSDTLFVRWPTATWTQVHTVIRGSSDLGDYDNDGDLDILLTGDPFESNIYRNDGKGNFTTAVKLPPVYKSGMVDVVNTPSASWSDYDNDGDLDILLVGRVGRYDVDPTAVIYRNDAGAFVPFEPALPQPLVGPSDWGDYDNDGDLDLLSASSAENQQPATRIFRNDGGTFTALDAGLPAVIGSSVAWGDADGDGDLDVLFAGLVEVTEEIYDGGMSTTTMMKAYSGLFRNDAGRFVLTDDELPLAYYGSWLDYDNDGDLDILLNGSEAYATPGGTGHRTFLKIIRNDGGRFREVAANLPGIMNGDVKAADLDRDGDLDLLASGYTRWDGTSRAATFYHRNETTARSHPPAAPPALAATVEDGALVLHWSPASDAETAPASLTYNLRVGTRPGASDVVSPMAHADGGRLLPAPGNAGHSLRWRVTGLDPQQRYYWSVQAVDAGLAASPFAAEQTVQPAAPTAGEAAAELPETPRLDGNYPNPFNPSTSIAYVLPHATALRLVVYDLLGAEVAVLVDGVQPAGRHEVGWDGRDARGRPVASGSYLYRLEAAGVAETRMMVLVK